MAVLARLLGIPARVVVGYTAGTPAGGNWVVKTSDAHAWPELYFQGLGWLRMEPTPSGTARGQGTASPPPYTQLTSADGTSPSGLLNPGGSTQGTRSHHNLLPGQIGGFGRKGAADSGTAGIVAPATGQGGLGVLFAVLAALLVVALLTPRVTRSLTRRRRWLTAHDDTARAHAAWRELLDDLADNGIGHWPGETPRAVAKRVTVQFRLAEPGRGGAAADRPGRGAGQLRPGTGTIGHPAVRRGRGARRRSR